MLTLNAENFDKVIKATDSKPVMVEFWAPWCPHCQKLGPVYDAVAEAHKNNFVIGKLNIDTAMAIAESYQVEVIPTIMIFAQGKPVRRVVNPSTQEALEDFVLGKNTETEPLPVEASPTISEETDISSEPAAVDEAEAGPLAPIYGFVLEKPNGELLRLSDYKGKVLLIVNTATGCGFTPQYKQLEEMYAKYKGRGFEIIDIPCNQFAGQAPGTDEEIHQFCTLKFGTSFPQMKKSDVNGPNALPIYGYLKSQKGFTGFGNSFKGLAMAAMLKVKDFNYQNNPDIKWNFTKFLIDRQGNVVARFEPTHDMQEVAKAVAACCSL